MVFTLQSACQTFILLSFALLFPLAGSAQISAGSDSVEAEAASEVAPDSLTPPALATITQENGDRIISSEIRMPVYNPKRMDAKIRNMIVVNPPRMPVLKGDFVNPLFSENVDSSLELDRFEPDSHFLRPFLDNN